jgi:serine/threonine protein kinase
MSFDHEWQVLSHMPTPESADEFLRLAEESGVVDKPELEKALESLTEQGADLSNASTLANSLVSNQTLTRWQAGKLLEGRHQGFMLGKYRLLSLLGKGSMGTVYLAEHTMMRRRVALKVLPFDHVQQPAYLDRFMREAQAVALLDHANIVRAYDVGKEHEGKRDVYYLAMEYVEGHDMAHYLKDNGPLDVVRAANLIRQVARGLSHAHDRGLTHRDVKPGNLLLDKDDVIRILDLGLAVFHSADQDEEASLTVSNNDHLLGTADYISPEQARNSHEVDHRTDIYSLGCTFYFMLTGHPPFREGTVAQRLLAHQTEAPAPVTKRRPNFPDELQLILDRMLAKTTDERFQSCHDVAGELKNWLLDNADDAWKAKHPEIFAADRISDDSVLEAPNSGSGASDTLAGPPPFDVESPLLDSSSPNEADASFESSDRTTSTNELPQSKSHHSTEQNTSTPGSTGLRVAIASCGLALLIAGLFAVQNLLSDTQTPTVNDPIPDTVPNSAPLVTTDADNPPAEEVASSTTPTTGSPTEHATAQPDSAVPDETSVVPSGPETKHSAGFMAWQKLSNELKQDPNIVLYLSFQEERTKTEDDSPIGNEAEFGSSFGISLKPKKKTAWVEGRWPNKKALHFDGDDAGQYLTANEFDSGGFNLTESLSLLVWFKVDRFRSKYQCLVSKGDYGFRLARMKDSSGLAFAINRAGPQEDAPINSIPMTQVGEDSYAVDDGQWHLAVGVVDASADGVTVSMFVDGEFRAKSPAPGTMIPNNDPVLIGANSFYLRGSKRVLEDGRTRSNPPRQFMGAIDEIAIFDRVLTPEEIAHIYEIGSTE